LEIISGGASTSLSLVLDHEMPERINHLRIGEAIAINKDMSAYWGYDFSHLFDDVFTLKAEIVEIKMKASHPIGEIFIDAFGNKPIYKDIGMRKKALLAVGRQDFANHNQLIPYDKMIKIVGSSSDHFIVDITESNKDYKIGDILSFQMYYEALLYLSGSKYVHQLIVDKKGN
jgi:predicted amino acid racemase